MNALAIAMAEHGLGIEDLMYACGLTREEAKRIVWRAHGIPHSEATGEAVGLLKAGDREVDPAGCSEGGPDAVPDEDRDGGSSEAGSGARVST